jgi:branched-chain amino acid transport system substrate-binding protein
MKLARSITFVAAAMVATLASAQSGAKLKVGVMLPSTGTFAALGVAIEHCACDGAR